MFYFTVELVNKSGYHLLTKEFTYNKANKRFKEFIRIYPKDRIELNHTNWVNTKFGYMPMAWYGPKIVFND